MTKKDGKRFPKRERNAVMDECFAHDDALRKNGHFVGGERFHPPSNERQISVTDGPYAETKEQLGGILVLKARDLNHAIQLMSNHPIQAGPFEIRPDEDLPEMIRKSERRRSKPK